MLSSTVAISRIQASSHAHEIPEGREEIKLQLSRVELTTRLGRKFPVDFHSGSLGYRTRLFFSSF
jgi:hypothetical protein